MSLPTFTCPKCKHQWQRRTSFDDDTRIRCGNCGFHALPSNFLIQVESESKPDEPEAPADNIESDDVSIEEITFENITAKFDGEERSKDTEPIKEEDREEVESPPAPAKIEGEQPTVPVEYSPVILEICILLSEMLQIPLTTEEKKRIKERATRVETQFPSLMKMASNGNFALVLLVICLATIFVPKLWKKFKPKKEEETRKGKKVIKAEYEDLPGTQRDPVTPAQQPPLEVRVPKKARNTEEFDVSHLGP